MHLGQTLSYFGEKKSAGGIFFSDFSEKCPTKQTSKNVCRFTRIALTLRQKLENMDFGGHLSLVTVNIRQNRPEVTILASNF